MVMNVANVLAAYKQGGGAAGNADAAQSASGGESFSDALKKFGDDAIGAVKDGEKAAVAGATGKADIASVVTAMNNAELMLQTVVTIRDKVIAAYQSITQESI